MIDLLEHPGALATGGAPPRVQAACSRTKSGAMAVEFRVEAGGQCVAVPSPGKAVFVEGLWNHTCFEVFLSPGDGPAYYEYNLSPSGQWALFSFRDYRDGGANPDPTLEPRIRFERTEQTMLLRAELPVGRLLGADADRPIRTGLSAVIEQSDGTIRYWALRHPGARPDFHHAESFALCVEESSEA
jgi:hypothetical protein